MLGILMFAVVVFGFTAPDEAHIALHTGMMGKSLLSEQHYNL